MKIFHFFSDSAHGWLRVTLSDLRNSGVFEKVSSYSYKKGNFAYLEEDCDAQLFLDGYKKLFGGDYQIREHDSVKNSSIRNMNRFWS